MRRLTGALAAACLAISAFSAAAEPLAQRCPDSASLESCVAQIMHDSERALAAALSQRASAARRGQAPGAGAAQRQWMGAVHASCAQNAQGAPDHLYDLTFAECVINAFDARLSQLERGE